MSDELTVLRSVIRSPVRRLEGFAAPPGLLDVVLTTSEVTALCPVTGQPDWYNVEIIYSPREKCLESKSLKLYLWSFRDEGIFCEALAARIGQDIMSAISPNWLKVIVTSNPRGGISIRATWQGWRPTDESQEVVESEKLEFVEAKDKPQEAQ